MKILLVEDEKELSKSILAYLKSENYTCELAEDFSSAREKTELYDYDCILLDISLPDGSGLNLLKELKNENKTDGVIIISAKNSLDDKIEGLQLGADDYLPKPFHLSELGARISAIIRRRKFNGNDHLIINNLVIDTSAKTISHQNTIIDFTKKEYDLMLYFAVNKNRVISKNAIAEHLSQENTDFFDNFDFLYAHIKNIKKKLASAGADDMIKSVYGMGYKLEAK
ncbi:response regulator transcription factor [Kaistella flava (ex Peng et al. 2021)]|uniref:Response regulator transcription factor n=1 Tax=Kaistella flava (ex Peng et al. 2021) TaxID=2038776 RepID=A0A7M2Y7I8_9FLAO|nr:response regulator transcription factor [Kaistella flava (ex Peng et al. 2021)]QOW09575.1 response regulator transcription factor [Kaistella flava (ex Peng et al. 2021)]